MSFVRARALRGLQSTLSRTTPRVASRRTQLVARRYASSEHGHGAPSSDLPWLISALVVTPVACYYLWPSASHADAGHHGEHDAHAEGDESHEEGKGEEEESDEPKEDEAPAEEKSEDKAEGKSEEGADEKPEEKSDEKPEEKSDDKPEEKSDEKSEEKPDEGSDEDEKSEDKSDEGSSDKQKGQEKTSSSGVNFKGKMHADSAGHNHTKKIEPGNKGGNRIRLDSGLGQNLGEGHSSDTPYNDSEGAPKTSASAISDKQKGLSNTDTRHSTRPDEAGSGFSTKGSGGPETAKSKNIIDHKAPVK